LAYSEDVDVFSFESFAESIEVQVRRDDVIVIEQEHEFGFDRIDREVSPDADSHIWFVCVNESATRCRVGVLRGEATIGLAVVHHDDGRVVDVLQQRFDESLARPRTVNRLDAKGNVRQVDLVLHQILRICRPTRMTCR
jgi:hypothetical protein